MVYVDLGFSEQTFNIEPPESGSNTPKLDLTNQTLLESANVGAMLLLNSASKQSAFHMTKYGAKFFWNVVGQHPSNSLHLKSYCQPHDQSIYNSAWHEQCVRNCNVKPNICRQLIPYPNISIQRPCDKKWISRPSNYLDHTVNKLVQNLMLYISFFSRPLDFISALSRTTNAELMPFGPSTNQFSVYPSRICRY